MKDFELAICSRCCSSFFTAFRTISKNLTVVGKRRRQLKKKLFILLWNLVRSNLTTGIDQGETSVSRKSLEMPSTSISAA